MHHPHGLWEWIGFLTSISTSASFICNLLPNEKFLDSYPRAQRLYGAAIKFTAAVAINLRHCLPSLDIPAPGLGITKKPE